MLRSTDDASRRPHKESSGDCAAEEQGRVFKVVVLSPGDDVVAAMVGVASSMIHDFVSQGGKSGKIHGRGCRHGPIHALFYIY